MTIPRTRSPQCANPCCVPGTVECPDCITHNGPTPYQIEVARHKQPPILTHEDANAFLERLRRELYGCTITGGWTPGHESTFTVTDPSGRRGYVRVLHNGKAEYTRPSLWLIPTHRTWLVFAWDNIRAKIFGSVYSDRTMVIPGVALTGCVKCGSPTHAGDAFHPPH